MPDASTHIWDLFPGLLSTVRQSHIDHGMIGGDHDIYHAARVANMAYQCALEEWPHALRVAELAGIAGLCHNADRLLQRKLKCERQEVDPKQAVKLLAEWLDGAYLINDAEHHLVTEAVLRHDGKNSADDSGVLIALMDGDRVVNLDLDVVMRSAQFHPDDPTVDYGHFLADPNARYGQARSVLRDFAYGLEWIDLATPFSMRTRHGKREATRRAARLQQYIVDLQAQLQDEHILPSPF